MNKLLIVKLTFSVSQARWDRMSDEDLDKATESAEAAVDLFVGYTLPGSPGCEGINVAAESVAS